MINYQENDLDRDLSALKEEVPPMPDGLHDAWRSQIVRHRQDAPTTQRRPLGRQIMSGLAAAAAVIFVAVGASITADRTPATENGLSAAQFKQSNTYDAAAGGMVQYSRSMDDGAVYDDTMLLTSDTSFTGETAVQERKIIRSVSMTIATDSFADALTGIKNACETGGGWIESISESGEDGDRRAWLTLRIPADTLDTFLGSLGSSGRITNRSESAQDVTDSYYDTQARLESQQALLSRLRELVDMAETLEDILALESQIADTQYQIDRLQESLLHTDRQVDYATVDITLREEHPADQAADMRLSFGARLSAALQTGGEVFATFLENAAVWLVSAIPFAGVVAALWLVWRLIRRKHK